MSEHSTKQGETDNQSRQELAADRLVYVMPVAPENAHHGAVDEEISLKQLWDVVWKGKWLIIVITAVFAVGSIVYAFAATPWYQVEILLAPSENESAPSMAGQLGGLAALAGVSIGGGSGGTVEAIATLESRDLAREFIESNELVPVLLRDKWDRQGDTPDIRDAIKVFHEKVLNVREDRESGLVTVTIEWVDPHIAAEWASSIVQLTNDSLRNSALQEADANVAYLKGELVSTNVVTLQQAIGRMLETEMQKLMLAKGNEEFAFRTVDSAEPAKRPSRPRRAIVTVIGTLLGGVISVFAVFFWQALRSD